MADMTPLDKAKALLDARRKATQGEWIRSKYGYQLLTEDSFAVIAKLEQCARREHDTKVQEYEWQQQEDNAKFIATAANHAEAICTRLIELEAKVQRMQEAIESSKEYASLAYCSGSDTSKRQECLGWEAKVACGSFGAPEFECHRMANNWFGQHYGAWNVIRALIGAMQTENAELRAGLEERRTSTNTLPNNLTYEDRTL